MRAKEKHHRIRLTGALRNQAPNRELAVNVNVNWLIASFHSSACSGLKSNEERRTSFGICAFPRAISHTSYTLFKSKSIFQIPDSRFQTAVTVRNHF